MSRLPVNIHIESTTTRLNSHGEKRIEVVVNFKVDGRNEIVSNILPVTFLFDEDGDLVNTHQYFSVNLFDKKRQKQKMQTYPIHAVMEFEEIEVTLKAAVENELMQDTEKISLLNELELFNRRNAIDYALRTGNKEVFNKLTSMGAIF